MALAPRESVRRSTQRPTRSSAAIPTPRASQIQPGWLRAQVVGRAQAAKDAVTLWLALPDTQRAPAPYQPGQFITLAIPSPRGLVYRSYSLCGEGRLDAPWEITVKRQEGGVASGYLYTNAQVGALLQCSPPLGSFTLPSRLTPGSTLIFVATGSGITPIMGMLRALARIAPSFKLQAQLHYAFRTPEDAIYGQALSTLDPQHQWLTQWRYVSSQGNRMSAERILAAAGAATPDAHWFVCGSDRLKRAMETLLQRRGVPDAHFHAESFGEMRRESAASIRLTEAPTTVRIRLAESGAILNASSQETLLEALERSGYRPPFSCRAGVCASCRLRLVAGPVSRGSDTGLTQAQRAAGDVLSCVTRPLGDVTIAGAGRKVAAAVALPAQGRPRTAARPRMALRWLLVAASLAVFTGAWSLTSHKPTSGSSSTATTSGSSSSSGGSGSSGNSGNTGGSTTTTSGSSGSSSSGTSQATATPITNTGVS